MNKPVKFVGGYASGMTLEVPEDEEHWVINQMPKASELDSEVMTYNTVTHVYSRRYIRVGRQEFSYFAPLKMSDVDALSIVFGSWSYI